MGLLVTESKRCKAHKRQAAKDGGDSVAAKDLAAALLRRQGGKTNDASVTTLMLHAWTLRRIEDRLHSSRAPSSRARRFGSTS